MRKFYLVLSAWTFAFAVSAQETQLAPSQDGARVLYVCTARSLLGKRFSATGDDKVLTQEAAMKQCEAYAFRCYRTGCQATDLR